MTSQIKSKLKVARGAYKIQVKGRLELAFEARATLLRGETLRGGDLVTAADGSVLEIVAAAEPVAEIRCKNPKDLSRVAHELGSRHVAVEFGDGILRIARAPALEAALKSLGAELRHLQASFDPDPGTYEGKHDHAHDHDHEHHHEHHGHAHKH